MEGVLEATRMRLLGRELLGGRGNGGEGLGLRAGKQGRFLYVAHESWPVNFSVVDVTDPGRPRLVVQVDLPHPRVRSNSLSVCGDLLAVAYQVQEAGTEPAGLEIFDISRPDRPRPVGRFDTAGPRSRGAHFVWWPGGRHLFTATGMPDFEPTHPDDDQIVVIVDVGDPLRPLEVGRWWLPGTRVGDEVAPPVRHQRWDLGFRAHNINVYPERPDRAYVGYLDGGVVILDISERASPRMVSRLDYHPPTPGFTHTVLPLLGRGLLAITDEALRDRCEDAPKNLWIADASDEEHPLIVAAAPLPGKDEFCRRGGRFGAHNLHENDPAETAWHSEEIVVGAFFNGGLRAFDVRDPFRPEEVGRLVPAAPPGSPAGAIQMNDVYVDERGVAYAVDRFTGGLYVVELDV